MCGAIGDEAACALAGISHRLRIPAGRSLYGAARQSQSLALIISGVVKLVITKPDGRQQIVGLQFPSDFVGRPFSENPNMSAEAATNLELCSFSGRAFDTLMREHPSVERALLKRIAGDLDTAREWAFLLGRTTALERVAALLRMITERLAPPSSSGQSPTPRTGMLLPLSRQEMAECLGLRLETVCRQITRLKARGIIATSGRRHFEVLDMPRLRACTDAANSLIAEPA
ncbi:Crp/Fnr family transcriptional regulator [Hyphomicrobium sp. CS1GBMeth3]|uniref:Crp/Fnr family transcriptional regulator n=1 Tax=Hyphomicrobium sp. CS1GBMeth3 TaxID=1892845 RepID=UPI000AA437D7|nr:Crp/Fnr family transcriptional regulator [Hyphomicrobium sp. CS1GBMeth3]